MIVLADNDIIHKLSCCQLLPEFMLWLKAPPAEIYVLPALPFVLRRKLKENKTALACLEDFLLLVKPVPAVQPETLVAFSNFDVGEQLLLASLYEDSNVTRLITGDKRALRQMSEACQTFPLFAARLIQVRADCFESVLLGLHNLIGFEALRDKVLNGIESDKVLQLSFGKSRNEQHMVSALNSYIADIRSYASFVADA
jgi:hypothetical protein